MARRAAGTRLHRRGERRSYRAPIASETTDPGAADSSGASREQRLAKNESFFREANELIARDAGLRGGEDCDFICECSARGCIDRVVLTRREYEHVRASGTHFVVVPGHENSEVERVVEVQPTYLVVEKQGEAAIEAHLTDPRDHAL